MIDDAAGAIGAADGAGRECHERRSYRHGRSRAASAPDNPTVVTPGPLATGHDGVVAGNIIYGDGIPGESELRLCGDVSGAKRTVELGVSDWYNSIAFAQAGAHAIAVDPNPERITEMRRRADEAELTVQCIEADPADLGDISSASCDVVVAAQTLLDVDDLGRLLRQVHRILVPSRTFVIAVPHPFASVSDSHPYGTADRTISGWFTALERSNFRVDQVREVGVGPTNPIPTTLILRARKEGS